MIAIGENTEQIAVFETFRRSGDVNINGVSIDADDHNQTLLDNTVLINHFQTTDTTNTLLYGLKGERQFPLLLQQGNKYLYAVDMLQHSILQNYLAETLHQILANNHASEHLAYLRLEDIHPLTDAEKLLEVGEYLNERHIPYILVVIPVYITPETGERVYLADAPDLVEVLHHLQNTGGTIIAHGYTHQYRDSETGEGFEFWDVENNQFIISNDPYSDIDRVKLQSEFANQEAYDAYIAPLKQQEQAYMDQKLTSSIHDLTTNDLFPLGFEAPHYTMSQQGYSITANYYSTLFGQIQLSDENWESMGAPPYVTTASFLHDMTLYPETIGYVDVSEQQPFLTMKKSMEKSLIVRDSVIGGFYHPYLGIEYLPELLEIYDSIPNLTWLDLKKSPNHTHTSKVDITSDTTGEVSVTNDLKWGYKFIESKGITPFEKVLWGITIVVFIFIIVFLFFTIYLRTQLKQRLFRERKKIG